MKNIKLTPPEEQPTPEQLERARKHTIIIYAAMIIMVMLPFVFYYFTK